MEINSINEKLRRNEIFKYLQEKLKLVKLPSGRWGVGKGNEEFFTFINAEEDFSIKKVITVYPSLQVDICINSTISPLSKYITVTNICELSDILNTVDAM